MGAGSRGSSRRALRVMTWESHSFAVDPFCLRKRERAINLAVSVTSVRLFKISRRVCTQVNFFPCCIAEMRALLTSSFVSLQMTHCTK